MKIAVNSRFMTRKVTGVERTATELVRSLLEMGSSSELELLGFAPNSTLNLENDLVGTLPVEHGRLPGQIWENFELPMRANGDWLLNLCNVGPMAYSRQATLIHDAQTFIEPSAYSKSFRAWYSFALPKIARRSQIILTVSEYSKSMLEEFKIVPVGKAKVIKNGADHITRIASDSRAVGKFGLRRHEYILAIGNLSPHKNQAMLMKAAANRQNGEPELVIAGGGNPKIFKDAGLIPPAGVRLLGRVTDQELKALYENALAFVFPSRTEGFGIPPLEAMICGCPVIASTGGAIPEVCGRGAIYASPDSADEWTAEMQRLAGSQSLRDEMIARGHEVAKNYTWKSSAEKIVEEIIKRS